MHNQRLQCLKENLGGEFVLFAKSLEDDISIVKEAGRPRAKSLTTTKTAERKSVNIIR